MNFAIIGYGAIGDVHARVIEEIEDSKLVAVATRTREKGKAAGEKYGCELYSDYRKMLQRDDIDVVSICLPSGMHYEAAMAAAAAGKHCIIEKPIEINEARSEEIIKTFAEKGLKLSVVFQHRFDRATQLLKRAIEKGEFGKLNYGVSQTKWFRDDEYYRQSEWRGTWAGEGGGALINQAIHSIDLLQYLMGPVEAVCGNCATLYHKEIETEDVGLALVKFKNGAVGTIEGTTLARPGFHSGIQIFGQTGTAVIKNDKLDFYDIEGESGDEFRELMEKGDCEITYGWYNLVPHIRQFQDVCDAIKNDRDPLVTGEEGLKALKIIKGIYQSSEMGKWVEIT